MKQCLSAKSSFIIFILSHINIAEKTYFHWQCSLPSTNSIQSLVEQNFEAFRVIGWPQWMSKNMTYRYINCAKKGLKRIPQGLHGFVEILDLRKNSITHIHKNDFVEYSALVAISIVDNCLFITPFLDPTIRRCSNYLTVENGAFSNLSKLKFLALSSTAIKQLPKMLPQNIQILMASFAFMGPVQKNDMEQLKSIELVSFSNNCILADDKHFCAGNFTITEPVFESTKVKFLDLAYNNFAPVPGYLFQQSLVGINLRGNPLNWIRANDFINATNITYLNLAWSSQYSKIPLQIENGSFQELKNLEILDLSTNLISILPPGLFSNNSKLRALNLELNCLKMIETNPIILPRLPLLEQLSLGGNTYCAYTPNAEKHTIPKLEFGNGYLHFPNLTSLSLGILQQFPNSDFVANYLYMYLSYGTKFDRVDNDSFRVLKQLPRLKNLGLVACGIRVMNASAFDGLNFKRLDLQVNKIGEALKTDKQKFNFRQPDPNNQQATELKNYNENLNVERLDIRDVFNSLHEKQHSWHEDAETRAVVNFSRNAISNLQLFSLKYFSWVTHLDLSRNNINYICDEDFQHLSQLQVLDLRYNPIRQINNKTLMPLCKLTYLRLNLTLYQRDFSIGFLQKAHQNITLNYGDTGWYIYRLFRYYGTGNNSAYFRKIISIDLSYIRIPPFYVSRNLSLFKPLNNLINLSINGAQLTFHPQSNFFGGVLKLQRLSMRDSWLENFPYVALKPLRLLEYLDLSHNKIEVLSKDENCGLRNLKTLILSHNLIYQILPGTLRSFSDSGLQKIDLSFNQIRFIDPTVIDRVVLIDMDYIDLRGNAVRCDCSLTDTFGWLILSKKLNNSKLPGFIPDCSNAVVNYYGGCIACDMYCTSKQSLSLFTFSITNHCHEHFFLRLLAWFTSSILLFLVIAFLCKALKKKFINFLLNDILVQSFLGRSNNEVSSRMFYAYHGFVYYDKNNEIVGNWVENLLIPNLEENLFFKMAVIGREDWCGTTQLQQLLLKMRASRKIIVILSDKFITNPKCKYVLSILEEWMYMTSEDKRILVVFNEADIEAYDPKLFQKKIRRNVLSMLYYSSQNEHSLFWDVLKNAIMLPSHQNKI